MAAGRKTGGGSRKGVPNKATAAAKQAFEYAFDELGGPEALTTWARDNQTDFYKLFARLIPAELKADVDGKLDITVTRRVVGVGQS